MKGWSVDFIEVDGLRLRCVLGVRDEERRDRSDVVIDLTVGTNATVIADSIEAVWDYRAAVKAVIAAVEASSFRTVERLADEIARTLVVGHRAPMVRVRVRKPGALRFADTVGISIERGPADYGMPAGPAMSPELPAQAPAACLSEGGAR